jgi:signal transduction histidine kinase
MLARLHEAFYTQDRILSAQRQFVGDASHELRAPLANLKGTMEVALRRTRSIEEYADALRTSLGEVERLSRLVSDLLTLTRADAGQLHCKVSDVELRSVLLDAMASAAARAEGMGVGLVAPDGPPVFAAADRDRVRQVIDNLLDNALRVAPRGTAVTLSVHQMGDRAAFRVRDRGPGVPEGHEGRLFDRFYRADPSRTRRSGGLGLGLAIAKATVEAMGGSIAVAGNPGDGAEFEVRLPMPSTGSAPRTAAQSPSNRSPGG